VNVLAIAVVVVAVNVPAIAVVVAINVPAIAVIAVALLN